MLAQRLDDPEAARARRHLLQRPIPPGETGCTLSTYRSCEVGADATDASAESPGSDGGMELDTG